MDSYPFYNILTLNDSIVDAVKGGHVSRPRVLKLGSAESVREAQDVFPAHRRGGAYRIGVASIMP